MTATRLRGIWFQDVPTKARRLRTRPQFSSWVHPYPLTQPSQFYIRGNLSTLTWVFRATTKVISTSRRPSTTLIRIVPPTSRGNLTPRRATWIPHTIRNILVRPWTLLMMKNVMSNQMKIKIGSTMSWKVMGMICAETYKGSRGERTKLRWGRMHSLTLRRSDGVALLSTIKAT